MKGTKIIISIVITVYNMEAYLQQCLDSISTARKGYEDTVECIIVDDGSSDKSVEIAQSYADSKNNAFVIEKKNEGVSKARNIGMYNARGLYVWFIDSDDYVSSDSLRVALDTIQGYNVDCIIFNYCTFKEHEVDFHHHIIPIDNADFRICTTRDKKLFLYQYTLRYKYGPTSWNKIYKLEIIKQCGLIYEPHFAIGEDFLFNIEFLLGAKTVITINKDLYFYRNRENSLANRLKSDLMITYGLLCSALYEYMKKMDMENVYIDYLSILFCNRMYNATFHLKDHQIVPGKIAVQVQAVRSNSYVSHLKWGIRGYRCVGRVILQMRSCISFIRVYSWCNKLFGKKSSIDPTHSMNHD